MLSKVFCFRLFTIGIIVGYLGMLASFLLAVRASLSFMFECDILADQVQRKLNNVTSNFMEIPIIVIDGMVFGIALLNLLACCLLVHGVMKEHHLMLLPWLIMFGLNFGLAVLVYVYKCIHLTYAVLFISVIPSTFSLALYIYIYYGIFSLYKQLQLCNDQRLQQNRAQFANVANQDYLSRYNNS